MEKDHSSNLFDFQLYSLAKQVKNLQKNMQEQGMFLANRELLTCPQCHLVEDVTCEGKLIVYQKEAALKDTQNRFIPLDNKDKRFKCPVCCTEIVINPLPVNC